MASNSRLRVFEYNEKALSISCPSQEHSFDDFLELLWDHASRSGILKYILNLETKVLPGKYRFVSQLNPDRALKRRKPQFISDVLQPFNPDIFNFRNVKPQEVLFELRPLHWMPDESVADVRPINLVIANISPLEHCNSLLVPDVYSCHPQVLTVNALRLVIETMLLSRSSDLRIGFNSLGGFASVNHQHFHLYSLKHRLYLENSPVKHIAGDCYEIVDFPARGFAFQIKDTNVSSTIVSVMKLVSLLLERKIAHNLFVTRGICFNCSNKDHASQDVVRVFLWARKFSEGAKDDLGFNPALCELAGHLPIKTKDFYDNICEEKVSEILSDVCHDVFMSVRDDVKMVFSS